MAQTKEGGEINQAIRDKQPVMVIQFHLIKDRVSRLRRKRKVPILLSQ